MAESNQDGSQISINFEDGNLASDGENFPMDWNIFDLSQEEISGGDSISFNLEGLDVEREETWNFEDLPFDQRSITSSMSWNVNDVGIDDLSVSSHDGIVEDEITEPLLESNELDRKEESELQESFSENQSDPENETAMELEQTSDNDSESGILADDGMQPSTSAMGANENTRKFSNENFEIEVNRIGFKRYTRFNATNVHYKVQCKAKPGHSNDLLKDALEGLVHSFSKVLEDLKSNIDGGYDRTLYLVSHFVIILLMN